MSRYDNMKRELLEYAMQSYREQLFAGTSGNLSSYDRQTDVMAITPTSVAYEGMGIEDIVVIKLDGTTIEGRHAPSSEWRMHAAVYRCCPQVGAIVHTHSPYATAFAVVHRNIPVILIEMVPFLGGDVAVAPFALPGTEDVGLTALDALTGRNACLLANHGVLAVGQDLAQAHIRAIYVEDAAKIYHLAKQSGEVHCIPDEFVRKMKGEA